MNRIQIIIGYLHPNLRATLFWGINGQSLNLIRELWPTCYQKIGKNEKTADAQMGRG